MKWDCISSSSFDPKVRPVAGMYVYFNQNFANISTHSWVGRRLRLVSSRPSCEATVNFTGDPKRAGSWLRPEATPGTRLQRPPSPRAIPETREGRLKALRAVMFFWGSNYLLLDSYSARIAQRSHLGLLNKNEDAYCYRGGAARENSCLFFTYFWPLQGSVLTRGLTNGPCRAVIG